MGKEKVVVTGGSGFLGSHVVDALAPSYELISLDDMSTGRAQNLAHQSTSVRAVKGDVRDRGLLEDLFRGATRVVHLAALTSVAESHFDPGRYHEVNVEGTRAVLEAAKYRDVSRVILASSAAVYGNAPGLPKHEDMPTTASSPYGGTKIAAEELLRNYNSNRMSTVSLRFFNLYGPRQRLDSRYAGVIPSFAYNLLANRPPIIFGTGQQTRDFLYVADAAEAVGLALEGGKGGASYNIGSGIAVPILEIAQLMAKIVGVDQDPKFAPPRQGDILHSWADGSRAAKEMGFRPRTPLSSGLVPTIEYFKERNPNL